MYTIQEGTHFITPFDGDTGEGKSMSAVRILSMSRRMKYHLKGLNVETWITWSPIQTAAKAWKGCFKPWDDILQDEHRSRDVGKGSGTASAMLSSLEQTSFRFDKNNVLFCAPSNHPHRYHFALEAVGWERELKIGSRILHNVNILVLFGPRFKMPLGMVYLSDEDWPTDPYILQKHDTDEGSWKRLVKRYGGIPPEADPDIIEFCEDKLLEHLKQHYPNEMFDMNRLELERVYTVELRLPTVFFMDQTLAGVLAEVRRLRRQRDAEESIEKQTILDEHRQEQEALMNEVALQVMKYFLGFTDDRLAVPPAGAIRDYLRRYTTLEPGYHQRCIDQVRHRWLKMQAGADDLREAERVALVPKPVAPADFSTDESYWLKQVRVRYPNLVMEKYFDAYVKYLDGEKGWTSEAKVGKSMPVPVVKSTVHEMFERIKGATKRVMGYDFERIMAHLYADSPMVLRMEPAVDEVARDGQPDRLVFLPDGRIRVCSWKIHNENESINVKDSPEIRVAGAFRDKKRVKMVLEGLFQGRFFSIEVDPEQTKGSVRVTKGDMMDWPPDMGQLLGEALPPTKDRLESSSPVDFADSGARDAIESVGSAGTDDVVETGCTEGPAGDVSVVAVDAGGSDQEAPGPVDVRVRRVKRAKKGAL